MEDNLTLKKNRPNILSKLGDSAVKISLDSLLKEYERYEHGMDFVHYWYEYFIDKTSNLLPNERNLFVDTAFDVYDTIHALLLKKREFPILSPDVKPFSSLKEDLKFKDYDYSIIQGALEERNRPYHEEKYDKNNKGYKKQFKEVRTVSECIDFIMANRVLDNYFAR